MIGQHLTQTCRHESWCFKHGKGCTVSNSFAGCLKHNEKQIMINRAQEHNDEATEVYDRISILTSSAAQGGGGSFKNRKPIGEVGCCESRMAERIH